ncbi:hypothetical protein PJP10_32700, partial [Mycobacterium kansasii]
MHCWDSSKQRRNDKNATAISLFDRLFVSENLKGYSHHGRGLATGGFSSYLATEVTSPSSLDPTSVSTPFIYL